MILKHARYLLNFSIPFTKSDSVLLPFEEQCGLKIDDICFDISKLNKYLQKLPSKLSCGHDGIPSVFLKKLYSSLSLPLSLLFQKSYNSGKLHSEWRNTYVVPIYKGKDKRSECSNYRLISLTSSVCKVMETYVCQHLVNYCDTNNLISDVQHGFRSKRSTHSNMLEMCNFMVNNIDCGNNVDLITIDLFKAFDSIPHNKLIHKLS